MSSAHLDGAMFVVFLIAVVVTIVYLLEYAGVIDLMPSFVG